MIEGGIKIDNNLYHTRMINQMLELQQMFANIPLELIETGAYYGNLATSLSHPIDVAQKNVNFIKIDDYGHLSASILRSIDESYLNRIAVDSMSNYFNEQKALIEAANLPDIALVAEAIRKINFEVPIINQGVISSLTNSLPEIPEFLNLYKVNKALQVMADSPVSFESMDEMADYLDENLEEEDKFSTEEVREVWPQLFREFIDLNESSIDNNQDVVKRKLLIKILIKIIFYLIVDICLTLILQEVAKPAVIKTSTVIKQMLGEKDDTIIQLDKGSDVMVVDEEGVYYKIFYKDAQGELKECFIEKDKIQFLEEVDK